MSSELNGKWTAHDVYTTVREDRRCKPLLFICFSPYRSILLPHILLLHDPCIFTLYKLSSDVNCTFTFLNTKAHRRGIVTKARNELGIIVDNSKSEDVPGIKNQVFDNSNFINSTTKWIRLSGL